MNINTTNFKPVEYRKDAVHVSIDLETSSLAPNAGILQLAASVINDRAISFNGYSTLLSNEKAERHIDVATMEWWSKQDPVLRAKVFNSPEAKELEQTLENFVDWCNGISGYQLDRIYLWSNGADFDLPILASAFNYFGTYPFNFRNHRCYRTEISAMEPNSQIGRADKFFQANPDYQAHDALWDAKFQGHMLSDWIG